MQTERSLDLLRQYAELRAARVRTYGELSESVRDDEALESARTAMALAGHRVGVEADAPIAA